MLQWICENIGTIAVGLVLLAVVILIVRIMMRDKKQGSPPAAATAPAAAGAVPATRMAVIFLDETPSCPPEEGRRGLFANRHCRMK